MYGARMDREAALLELATTHAVALRLRDAGVDEQSIGQALAVPPAAVASLLSIAESKLAALLAENGDPPLG